MRQLGGSDHLGLHAGTGKGERELRDLEISDVEAESHVTSMLLCTTLVACSSALQPPSNQASRRAVLASAAAVTLAAPRAALANNAGASKVASGFVQVPAAVVTAAQVKKEVFEPLERALASKDWSAAASFYLPDAAVVDGTARPIAFLKGSDVKGHFASTMADGVVSLDVSKCTLEGDAFELSTTAHVIYNLERAGVKYQGLMRLQKTTDRLTVDPGGWKIDEDVYPLDKGSIYALVQPQRAGPNVFMSLDPKVKAKYY